MIFSTKEDLMTPREHSSFHTDQNRWDRQDFENNDYSHLINDNEERSSLQGRRAEEYDEGLAMDYHEDTYRPPIEKHLWADHELEKAIKELLKNSQKVDARDITVTVDHCDVTLSGTVPTQEQRDYALSVVKIVHGVGLVKSDLIVKTHGGVLPSDFGRDNPH
jgi:hypothetical protein